MNGEPLSEAELQELLASVDGLVRLKGQWVEVDREKLAEALKHWKTVERAARAGGLSFFEGMRLLSGVSLESAAAASLVRHLLWTWNRNPDRAGLLLQGGGNPDLVSFRRLGFTFSTPERSADGWSIPATLFGRTDGGFAFRRVAFRVRSDAGRLVVDPVRLQGLRYVRTIGQAVRLLRSMLTVDVVAPAGLPQGTHLAATALSAWSWGGRTTGQLGLVVPGTSGNPKTLSVFYGQGGFGCGPSPVPLQLTTGTSAIASDPTESGSYTQVAWPAGPNDFSGPLGLSGTLPRETMIGIAAAMDADRLAARG